MNNDDVASGILVLVLITLTVSLSIFLYSSNESTCIDRYGSEAKVHHSRSFNECILPDGTIKGL